MPLSDAHNTILNSFKMPDERSFGVYNLLKELYPAFAKKLFENNVLMHNLVMSNLNGMDILEYPICGKCETISAWDKNVFRNGRWYKTCHCVAKGCGAVTVSPPTLRDWIRDEFKKKASPEVLESLEYVVDSTALYMMYTWVKDTRAALAEHNRIAREKMRSDADISSLARKYKEEDPTVQHYGYTKPEKIDNVEEIKEDITDD